MKKNMGNADRIIRTAAAITFGIYILLVRSRVHGVLYC